MRAGPKPVALDGRPGCPVTVWDGPYSTRCGAGASTGRCAHHGPFSTVAPATPSRTRRAAVSAEELTVSEWLRIAADRCCQCTDGHCDHPSRPFGTDSDVRISRDLAREIADTIERVERAEAAAYVSDERRLALIARVAALAEVLDSNPQGDIGSDRRCSRQIRAALAEPVTP